MEKKGISFDIHSKHEHEFWKYCNYLTYLKQKDPEDFTGLEMQIWEAFTEKNVSWIPQASDEDLFDQVNSKLPANY